MAIFATLTTNQPTIKRWSVLAEFDTDVLLDIPLDGMELLPNYVAENVVILLTPITSAARLSNWIGDIIFDEAVAQIVKTTAVGSGDDFDPQLYVTVMLPHSIL